MDTQAQITMPFAAWTRGMIKLTGVLIALGTPGLVTAGPLGDLAATMQPGTFAQLTSMNGWNAGGILVPTEFGCTSGDYVTQYADGAAWDGNSNRVLLVGQTHGNCYAGNLIIYSETTNTWSKGPYPPGICQSGTPSSPCFAHAYDHNAVDPATGDLYYRHYGTSKVWRFRDGAWTAVTDIPAPSSQCCGAMQFFREMNRLIFIDGDWGMWAYNPTSNSWTHLANTNAASSSNGLPNLPMSSFHNFAQYNAVEKILLFGGGDKLYKMSANGTITTLKAPPTNLGINTSITSYDPASGLFLVLVGSSFYQYNSATDVWALLPTTVPSVLSTMGGLSDGLVESTLNEYGVIMYTKYSYASSTVYLYKHSPYTPITPNTPTSLAAQ